MKPFDQIAELYQQYECSRTFDEDICAHIETGYVISTPEYFLLGRPVDRWADPALITNPWHAFPKESHNAWLCYALAGRGVDFTKLAPYPLEWAGWQRRGKGLRWWRMEKLRRGDAPNAQR